MSRKLLPADFIDIIAQNQGITKKKSEAFIRAFFEVIEEGLQNDSFVKIRGLGTFKLVSVSERESVNINTGERFQISGHTKVSFIPDNSFKELINRPFSHFETIVIPESTTIDEIEAITEDFTEEQSENNDALLEVTLTTDYTPENDFEHTESAIIESLLTTELDNDSSSHNNIKPIHSLSDEDVNTIQDNTIDESKEKNNIENEVPVSPINMEHITETDNSLSNVGDTQDVNISINASNHNKETKVNDGQVEESEKTDVPTDCIDTIQENSHTHTPTEENEMNTPQPTKKSKWLIISIIWIISIIVSYLAGYHRIITIGNNIIEERNPPAATNDSTTKNTPTVETQNTSPDVLTSSTTQNLLPKGGDTLSVIRGIDRPTANILAEGYPQVEVGSFLIIGTYSKYIYKKGDTLHKIARETYGHKDYAKYIILYNKLVAPYNIPVESEILLPQLVEKEEFAS